MSREAGMVAGQVQRFLFGGVRSGSDFPPRGSFLDRRVDDRPERQLQLGSGWLKLLEHNDH